MATFGVGPYLPDSGKREQFPTGSQRDTREGKGRYDLIPPIALRRLALRFEQGAQKYDVDNWKKGQPLTRYVDSLIRHLLAAVEGQTDEDHEAAVLWNAAAFMWTRDAIDRGLLHPSLDDRPREVLLDVPR